MRVLSNAFLRLQYRTAKNFTDPGFWVPRLADKIVMSALIIVTYYGIGDNRDALNTNNIAAALFLIVVLPMFSAGIYTPTLVLGTSVVVPSAVLSRSYCAQRGLCSTVRWTTVSIVPESISSRR